MKDIYGITFSDEEYQRLEPLIPMIGSMGSNLSKFSSKLLKVSFMAAFLDLTENGHLPTPDELRDRVDDLFAQAVADVHEFGDSLSGKRLEIGRAVLHFTPIQ